MRVVEEVVQTVEPTQRIDAGFLERVWPSVARLVQRLVTGDGWQDAAQDALLEAWRRRHAFDPSRGRAEAWVLAIAVSHARRTYRPPVQQIDVAIPSSTPDQATVSETRLDVLRAVDRLPTRQRLAVILRYFLDLPDEDIAEVMGCRVGTVKSTLAAARNSLHTHLGGTR